MGAVLFPGMAGAAEAESLILPPQWDWGKNIIVFCEMDLKVLDGENNLLTTVRNESNDVVEIDGLLIFAVEDACEPNSDGSG